MSVTPITACCITDCPLPAYKATYCNGHYIRKRRGSAMDVPIRRRGSDPERFWQKVTKTPDCWEWNAYRDRAGYGRFDIAGTPILAHRVAYEREHGPIPPNLEVDHICHNHACVRPEHLRLATRSLNGQNMSGARVDSASGIRGVRQLQSGRWQAGACLNKKRVNLGTFSTKEEAADVVSAWRREHMPYSMMDKKGRVE